METTTDITNTKTKAFRRFHIAKPGKVASAKCDRCGGAGGWQGWPGFTCYRCGGNGIDPTNRDWGFPADWTDAQCAEFTAAREARNTAARDRAQAKREAARLANWTANVARCPQLQLVHDHNNSAPAEDYPSARWSEFIMDIMWKARDFELTDRQLEAFAKAVDATIEREQAKADAPEVAPWEVTGKRQRVEGTIATFKWQDSNFGSTLKIRLVTDAGQGLWVTCPQGLRDCEKGARVAFDVAVQVSHDDPTFAFGSRPTKEEVL